MILLMYVVSVWLVDSDVFFNLFCLKQPTNQPNITLPFGFSICDQHQTRKKNPKKKTTTCQRRHPFHYSVFLDNDVNFFLLFCLISSLTILVSCPNNIPNKTKQKKMSGAFWSLTPLCYFQKNIIIMNCNQKLHHFLSFCFLFLHPKVSTDQSKIFVCVCEIFCNRM